MCWMWIKQTSRPCLEKEAYSLLVRGEVVAGLCEGCAREAEKGIMDGSMLYLGEYQTRQTASLVSLRGGEGAGQ